MTFEKTRARVYVRNFRVTLMNQIMFFLLTVFMMSGTIFAQEHEVMTSKGSSWGKEVQIQIDQDSEWGKWFVNTFEPYWEKMQKAISSPQPSAIMDKNKTQEEVNKTVYGGFVETYRDIQKITPPPEFNNYHTKMLEFFLLASTSTRGELFQNKEKMSKLYNEAFKEFDQVLRDHNVPENVIDELGENP